MIIITKSKWYTWTAGPRGYWREQEAAMKAWWKYNEQCLTRWGMSAKTRHAGTARLVECNTRLLARTTGGRIRPGERIVYCS